MHHATVSGRAAVAMTRSPAERASGIKADPTPPAPLITNSALPESPPFTSIPIRSKSSSQAVSPTNGKAAASAKVQPAGFRATSRESTAWNSALLPARVTSPA